MASSNSGYHVSCRPRHHDGGEKALLKSAGIRCAFGIACFFSSGLVSGGLRKQASSFLHRSAESEVVAQYVFQSPANFSPVIGPFTLALVAIATGLRRKPMEECILIASVVRRNPAL